jgi:hypothetical protein
MPKVHKGTRDPYKPRYCNEIIEFFSPPYYTIKDMTITKADGTTIDKTEMEALPPRFLSDFGKEIGIKRGYHQCFELWAKKHPDFAEALKEAKKLEIQMYRVNGSMGLYHGAFTIFTLKNIAGWRDKAETEHSFDDGTRRLLANALTKLDNRK